MRPGMLRDRDADEHEKLRELILYIADRCQEHPKFGAVKLNKILFFADFIAYARRGNSITGETYFKLRNGPAPKRLLRVVAELKASRDVREEQRPYAIGVQKRLIALRKANLALFDRFEISLVDEVIEALKDKDAEEVSGLSHRFIGYNLVGDREEIPYESVFARDPDDIVVTEDHRRRAERIAKEHGLR